MILNPLRSHTKAIQCFCPTHIRSVSDSLRGVVQWTKHRTVMDEPVLSPMVWPQNYLHLSVLQLPHKICLTSSHRVLLRHTLQQVCFQYLPWRPNRKAKWVVNRLLRLLQLSPWSWCLCVHRQDPWAQVWQAQLPAGYRAGNISENLGPYHNLGKAHDAKFPVHAAVLHSSSSGIPETDFNP